MASIAMGVQTVMKHAVEHYFGGGSELLNMHERMADLLLIALSSSFEDAGNCCAWPWHLLNTLILYTVQTHGRDGR